ncbi:unnamed protein product, partial [Amoebophrya sp. A120]|eukprot:GSA120T00009912001.1
MAVVPRHRRSSREQPQAHRSCCSRSASYNTTETSVVVEVDHENHGRTRTGSRGSTNTNTSTSTSLILSRTRMMARGRGGSSSSSQEQLGDVDASNNRPAGGAWSFSRTNYCRRKNNINKCSKQKNKKKKHQQQHNCCSLCQEINADITFPSGRGRPSGSSSSSSSQEKLGDVDVKTDALVPAPIPREEDDVEERLLPPRGDKNDYHKDLGQKSFTTNKMVDSSGSSGSSTPAKDVVDVEQQPAAPRRGERPEEEVNGEDVALVEPEQQAPQEELFLSCCTCAARVGPPVRFAAGQILKRGGPSSRAGSSVDYNFWEQQNVEEESTAGKIDFDSSENNLLNRNNYVFRARKPQTSSTTESSKAAANNRPAGGASFSRTNCPRKNINKFKCSKRKSKKHQQQHNCCSLCREINADITFPPRRGRPPGLAGPSPSSSSCSTCATASGVFCTCASTALVLQDQFFSGGSTSSTATPREGDMGSIFFPHERRDFYHGDRDHRRFEDHRSSSNSKGASFLDGLGVQARAVSAKTKRRAQLGDLDPGVEENVNERNHEEDEGVDDVDHDVQQHPGRVLQHGRRDHSVDAGVELQQSEIKLDDDAEGRTKTKLRKEAFSRRASSSGSASFFGAQEQDEVKRQNVAAPVQQIKDNVVPAGLASPKKANGTSTTQHDDHAPPVVVSSGGSTASPSMASYWKQKARSYMRHFVGAALQNKHLQPLFLRALSLLQPHATPGIKIQPRPRQEEAPASLGGRGHIEQPRAAGGEGKPDNTAGLFGHRALLSQLAATEGGRAQLDEIQAAIRNNTETAELEEMLQATAQKLNNRSQDFFPQEDANNSTFLDDNFYGDDGPRDREDHFSSAYSGPSAYQKRNDEEQAGYLFQGDGAGGMTSVVVGPPVRATSSTPAAAAAAASPTRRAPSEMRTSAQLQLDTSSSSGTSHLENTGGSRYSATSSTAVGGAPSSVAVDQSCLLRLQHEVLKLRNPSVFFDDGGAFACRPLKRGQHSTCDIGYHRFLTPYTDLDNRCNTSDSYWDQEAPGQAWDHLREHTEFFLANSECGRRADAPSESASGFGVVCDGGYAGTGLPEDGKNCYDYQCNEACDNNPYTSCPHLFEFCPVFGYGIGDILNWVVAKDGFTWHANDASKPINCQRDTLLPSQHFSLVKKSNTGNIPPTTGCLANDLFTDFNVNTDRALLADIAFCAALIQDPDDHTSGGCSSLSRCQDKCNGNARCFWQDVQDPAGEYGTCPTFYHRKNGGATCHCLTGKCDTNKDRDRCCDPNPKCKFIHDKGGSNPDGCSNEWGRGWRNKGTAANTVCTNQNCDHSSDKARCCQETPDCYHGNIYHGVCDSAGWHYNTGQASAHCWANACSDSRDLDLCCNENESCGTSGDQSTCCEANAKCSTLDCSGVWSGWMNRSNADSLTCKSSPTLQGACATTDEERANCCVEGCTDPTTASGAYGFVPPAGGWLIVRTDPVAAYPGNQYSAYNVYTGSPPVTCASATHNTNPNGKVHVRCTGSGEALQLHDGAGTPYGEQKCKERCEFITLCDPGKIGRNDGAQCAGSRCKAGDKGMCCTKTCSFFSSPPSADSSTSCGPATHLKDDAATIRCRSKECNGDLSKEREKCCESDHRCDDATKGVACDSNFYQRQDSDQHADPSEALCCREKCSAAGACPAGYHQKDNPDTINCGAYQCDLQNSVAQRGQCCNANPTCDPGVCPADTHHFDPAKSATTCAAKVCTISECCLQNAKCDTLTCDAGTHLIPQAGSTVCKTASCSSSEENQDICCEGDHKCNDADQGITCGVGYQLQGTRSCTHGVCTDAKCCFLKCSHAGNCPANYHKKNDLTGMLTCGAHSCNLGTNTAHRDRCCDLNDYCSASVCPPGTHHLVQATTFVCASSQCQLDECCEENETCDNLTCGPFTHQIDNAAQQHCAAATCTPSQDQGTCCESNDVCTVSLVCPQYKHHKDQASSTACANAVCTLANDEARCCEDNQKCSHVPCGSIWDGYLQRSNAATLSCESEPCDTSSTAVAERSRCCVEGCADPADPYGFTLRNGWTWLKIRESSTLAYPDPSLGLNDWFDASTQLECAPTHVSLVGNPLLRCKGEGLPLGLKLARCGEKCKHSTGVCAANQLPRQDDHPCAKNRCVSSEQATCCRMRCSAGVTCSDYDVAGQDYYHLQPNPDALRCTNHDCSGNQKERCCQKNQMCNHLMCKDHFPGYLQKANAASLACVTETCGTSSEEKAQCCVEGCLDPSESDRYGFVANWLDVREDPALAYPTTGSGAPVWATADSRVGCSSATHVAIMPSQSSPPETWCTGSHQPLKLKADRCREYCKTDPSASCGTDSLHFLVQNDTAYCADNHCRTTDRTTCCVHRCTLPGDSFGYQLVNGKDWEEDLLKSRGLAYPENQVKTWAHLQCAATHDGAAEYKCASPNTALHLQGCKERCTKFKNADWCSSAAPGYLPRSNHASLTCAGQYCDQTTDHATCCIEGCIDPTSNDKYGFVATPDWLTVRESAASAYPGAAAWADAGSLLSCDTQTHVTSGSGTPETFCAGSGQKLQIKTAYCREKCKTGHEASCGVTGDFFLLSPDNDMYCVDNHCALTDRNKCCVQRCLPPTDPVGYQLKDGKDWVADLLRNSTLTYPGGSAGQFQSWAHLECSSSHAGVAQYECAAANTALELTGCKERCTKFETADWCNSGYLPHENRAALTCSGQHCVDESTYTGDEAACCVQGCVVNPADSDKYGFVAVTTWLDVIQDPALAYPKATASWATASSRITCDSTTHVQAEGLSREVRCLGSGQDLEIQTDRCQELCKTDPDASCGTDFSYFLVQDDTAHCADNHCGTADRSACCVHRCTLPGDTFGYELLNGKDWEDDLLKSRALAYPELNQAKTWTHLQCAATHAGAATYTCGAPNTKLLLAGCQERCTRFKTENWCPGGLLPNANHANLRCAGQHCDGDDQGDQATCCMQGCVVPTVGGAEDPLFVHKYNVVPSQDWTSVISWQNYNTGAGLYPGGGWVANTNLYHCNFTDYTGTLQLKCPGSGQPLQGRGCAEICDCAHGTKTDTGCPAPHAERCASCENSAQFGVRVLNTQDVAASPNAFHWSVDNEYYEQRMCWAKCDHVNYCHGQEPNNGAFYQSRVAADFETGAWTTNDMSCLVPWCTHARDEDSECDKANNCCVKGCKPPQVTTGYNINFATALVRKELYPPPDDVNNFCIRQVGKNYAAGGSAADGQPAGFKTFEDCLDWCARDSDCKGIAFLKQVQSPSKNCIAKVENGNAPTDDAAVDYLKMTEACRQRFANLHGLAGGQTAVPFAHSSFQCATNYHSTKYPADYTVNFPTSKLSQLVDLACPSSGAEVEKSTCVPTCFCTSDTSTNSDPNFILGTPDHSTNKCPGPAKQYCHQCITDYIHH